MKSADWYDVKGPEYGEFLAWADIMGASEWDKVTALARLRSQRALQLQADLEELCGPAFTAAAVLGGDTNEAIDMAHWVAAYKHRKIIATLLNGGRVLDEAQRGAINAVDRWY